MRAESINPGLVLWKLENNSYREFSISILSLSLTRFVLFGETCGGGLVPDASSWAWILSGYSASVEPALAYFRNVYGTASLVHRHGQGV
jgi:hypothetical protein